MTPTVLNNFVSRKAFATAIGRSERTVIRYELQRRAPRRTKIGRSTYYSKQAIEDWLREREQER